MTMWWNFLLAVLLYLTYATPSCLGFRHPSKHSSFTHSLRVTRSVRASVQKLLVTYKEQLLGDKNFEDKRLVLESLPAVNFNYSTWVLIKDAERLCWDADGLSTFWVHLETQRLLLQSEASTTRARTPQRRDRVARAHADLCQSIEHIQMDLRDLLKHVNAQLTSLNSNKTDLSVPCSPRAVPVRVTQSSSSTAVSRRSPRSLWAQRQEGYVVLRDLNRFLFRLTLDFNFLKANLPAQ